MARFKHILTISLVALMALGLVIACQQMPLDPLNAPDQAQTARYQAVPVSPEFLGLAKTTTSDVESITVAEDGTLGGFETNGNFVEIPPNTLEQDADLQFTLDYVDDPADSFSGALTYEVVKIVNDETGEVVEGVVDAGDYWMIEVPHFSAWG